MPKPTSRPSDWVPGFRAPDTGDLALLWLHRLSDSDARPKVRFCSGCIAVGDSFNDVSMLTAAERGILIYPSEKALPVLVWITGSDSWRCLGSKWSKQAFKSKYQNCGCR